MPNRSKRNMLIASGLFATALGLAGCSTGYESQQQESVATVSAENYAISQLSQALGNSTVSDPVRFTGSFQGISVSGQISNRDNIQYIAIDDPNVGRYYIFAKGDHLLTKFDIAPPGSMMHSDSWYQIDPENPQTRPLIDGLNPAAQVGSFNEIVISTLSSARIVEEDVNNDSNVTHIVAEIDVAKYVELAVQQSGLAAAEAETAERQFLTIISPTADYWLDSENRILRSSANGSLLEYSHFDEELDLPAVDSDAIPMLPS